MIDASILRFINWNKNFHIHLDASRTIIRAILTQLGEKGMDYPIYYASKKLPSTEKNYNTMEREALGTSNTRVLGGCYLFSTTWTSTPRNGHCAKKKPSAKGTKIHNVFQRIIHNRHGWDHEKMCSSIIN